MGEVRAATAAAAAPRSDAGWRWRLATRCRQPPRPAGCSPAPASQPGGRRGSCGDFSRAARGGRARGHPAAGPQPPVVGEEARLARKRCGSTPAPGSPVAPLLWLGRTPRPGQSQRRPCRESAFGSTGREGCWLSGHGSCGGKKMASAAAAAEASSSRRRRHGWCVHWKNGENEQTAMRLPPPVIDHGICE